MFDTHFFEKKNQKIIFTFLTNFLSDSYRKQMFFRPNPKTTALYE